MSLYRIYLFCSLTAQVYVEQGVLDGRSGLWFADLSSGARRFYTEPEIELVIAQSTAMPVAG